MIYNLKRNTGYVFWSFAEQASVVALPRLVLWPIAAYIIGKESFGVFVFSFAITSILGLQPANGLATGLLRHLSDYDEESRKQLCGIAMRLCHKAMIFVVLIGLFCSVVAGSINLLPHRVIYCLIPLILSQYSENQTHLLLTESRFLREFRSRALWFAVRSIINLLGGIGGAMVAGLVGLAWGFTIGNILVYAALKIRYNKYFVASDNVEMVAVLKKVWLQITIAGIIALAGPYLNRLVLGSLHGFKDTADLVAATSVTYIFLAPITGISGLLLSIISPYITIRSFSRRAVFQWLCMLVLGAIVCPLCLRLFASNIMNLLYPNFGEESVRLLKILIWIVVSESLVSLFRPFVMKFGSVKLVPIINGISLAATLVPALCLIPTYRTFGAAWAIVIGSAITATLWSSATVWIYLRSPIKGK